METANVLPNSRAKRPTGIVFRSGVPWVPIFCANCGADGGLVPEENCDFAFYLCDSPCAEQWGQLAGTMRVPDEVFWAKVKAAQLEAYGRELTEQEILVELAKESSVLSKLAREKGK